MKGEREGQGFTGWQLLYSFFYLHFDISQVYIGIPYELHCHVYRTNIVILTPW